MTVLEQFAARVEAGSGLDEEAFEAARVAWLESASDYTRLDEKIAAAITAYLDAAEIARLRAVAGEPVGWRLVPVEPTDKMMLMGGFRFAGRVPNSEVFKEVRRGWDDMLAAAPAPPAPALPSVDAVAEALYDSKPHARPWATLPDEFRRQCTKQAERVLALFRAPAEKEPT